MVRWWRNNEVVRFTVPFVGGLLIILIAMISVADSHHKSDGPSMHSADVNAGRRMQEIRQFLGDCMQYLKAGKENIEATNKQAFNYYSQRAIANLMMFQICKDAQ